jgi:molecular chaperone DnaK (HSP70)
VGGWVGACVGCGLLWSAGVCAQFAKNKTTGQFRVVGKAWDMTLGGSNFDSVLIEKMADAFNALGHLGKGGDIRTLPKAMTKIRKNAQKVRSIPPPHPASRLGTVVGGGGVRHLLCRLCVQAPTRPPVVVGGVTLAPAHCLTSPGVPACTAAGWQQVKEVLSANDMFPVSIESLAVDKDFRMPLNRALLEEWCAPLLARVTKPIDAALADAGLTKVRYRRVARAASPPASLLHPPPPPLMLVLEPSVICSAFPCSACLSRLRQPSRARCVCTCGAHPPSLPQADIHAVEIIGGGVRVPRVQALLADYFGSLPIGTHLNGDEASVMGAAFMAANRSSAFRVKPVGALDTTPFSVSVNLTSLHPEDDVEADTTATADADDAAAAAAGASGGEEGEGEEAAAAAAPSAGGGKAWARRTHMFPKFSVVGTTKKVSFRRAKDLAAVMYYDATTAARLPEGTRCVFAASGPAGFPRRVRPPPPHYCPSLPLCHSPPLASLIVAKYNVTGISDIEKSPKGALGTPKVTLTFGIDGSGVYRLKSAEAVLEEMVEVVKPTPKPKKSRPPLFKKSNTTSPVNGSDDANATATATESASESPKPTPVQTAEEAEASAAAAAEAAADANTTAADNTTAAATDGEDTGAEATPTPEPVKVMKKVVHRIPLKVTADFSELAVKPLTERQRSKSLRTYVACVRVCACVRACVAGPCRRNCVDPRVRRHPVVVCGCCAAFLSGCASWTRLTKRERCASTPRTAWRPSSTPPATKSPWTLRMWRQVSAQTWSPGHRVVRGRAVRGLLCVRRSRPVRRGCTEPTPWSSSCCPLTANLAAPRVRAHTHTHTHMSWRCRRCPTRKHVSS